MTITLTARDPAGLTATQSFSIRVGVPDNRAPEVRQRLTDGTVQQGGTLRYSRMSAAFSDPDGDRLTLSVSSDAPSFATARLSGDDLIVTGVQAFTRGAVTITVTARDTAGLTATQSLSIRVSAPPDLWAAISVSDVGQNCRRNAAGFAWDYSSRASAERGALSECRDRGGSCRSSRVISWRNGCGAYAEGEGCGSGWAGGSSRVSAEQRALSLCRSETRNCSIRRSICTSNVR